MIATAGQLADLLHTAQEAAAAADQQAGSALHSLQCV